jgi:hypothetical protein
MNEQPIILALISAVVAIIVALITAYFAARAATDKRQAEINVQLALLDGRITKLAFQVELLWELGVKDALREAKKQGLVQQNSPMRPTKKWEQLVSQPLRTSLEMDLAHFAEVYRSPYDIAVEAYVRHRGPLEALALRADLPHALIFAMLAEQAKVYRQQVIDRVREQKTAEEELARHIKDALEEAENDPITGNDN